MISFFRKNRRGVVGTFIVGMCALLMLPFGLDYFGRGSSSDTSVATVGGQEISARDYDRALYGVRARMKQQFGENYPQIAAMLNLKQKVLDDMINDVILDKFYSKSGFAIGLGHIESYIRSLPIFKDGVSREKFSGLLKAQGISEREFERDVSKTLMHDQLEDIFLLGGTLSAEELRERYKRIKQELVVSYGKVVATSKAPEVTDEEIKKYFAEHEKSFMTAKEFQVQFLKFPAEAFSSKVSVQEEDLQDAYRKYENEFLVKGRVILEQLTFNRKAPDFLSEGGKEQENLGILVKATRDEIFSKPDSFKQFGSSKGGIYSLDSKEKSLDELPKDIQKALKNLKEGEVSEVIETEGAYYIVRPKLLVQSSVKPFAEVKVELEKLVRRDLAPDIAMSFAQEAKDKLIGKDKELVVEDMKKRAVGSGLEFSELKGPASSFPKNRFEAFSSKMQGDMGVVEEGGASILFHISEVTQPRAKLIDEVKVEIKQYLVKEKEAENSKQAARELLVAARHAGDKVTYAGFMELAKKKNISLTEAKGSLSKIQLPFLVDEEMKSKVLSQVVSVGIAREPLEGADGSVYVMVLKRGK